MNKENLNNNDKIEQLIQINKNTLQTKIASIMQMRNLNFINKK